MTPALDKARMLPFWNCMRGLKLTTVHCKTYPWRHRDRAMQLSVQRLSSAFAISYCTAILNTRYASPLCEPPPLLAIGTATQPVGLLVSPVWHLTSDQTRSLYEISGRILICIRHIAAPCSESTSGTPPDSGSASRDRGPFDHRVRVTTVEPWPCSPVAALQRPLTRCPRGLLTAANHGAGLFISQRNLLRNGDVIVQNKIKRAPRLDKVWGSLSVCCRGDHARNPSSCSQLPHLERHNHDHKPSPISDKNVSLCARARSRNNNRCAAL